MGEVKLKAREKQQRHPQREPLEDTGGEPGDDFPVDDLVYGGDLPDVLVAMNPAALKKNLKELKRGGTLIVNSDAFDQKNLKLAHYDVNPLEDDTLRGYELYPVPISSLTANALEGLPKP